MSNRTLTDDSSPQSSRPPGLSRRRDVESPEAASPPQEPEYAFDNAWQLARQRLSALEGWLDRGTIRSLTACGVDSGWSCLEIGGGGGSVANWLCDRVGPAGHVVATDIDPRFLNQLKRPNLEVWHHDIVTDYLPRDTFDLVHTRLVLAHMAEPRSVIRRIVGALKPGGWLVAEELDFISLLPLSTSDTENQLFTRLIEAHHQVVASHGFDPSYGRRLLGDFRAEALSPVDTECSLALWHGGSFLARVFQLTFLQLKQELMETYGVWEADLAALDALLDDPGFSFMGQVTVTAWGRRPEA